jgi:hypothetical protein
VGNQRSFAAAHTTGGGTIISLPGLQMQRMDYGLCAVKGAENHLHMLVRLRPAVAPVEAAKNLKGARLKDASSHYINKESGLNETLCWHAGYGVVTLRESEVPRVVRYIQRQKSITGSTNLSAILEQIEADDD